MYTFLFAAAPAAHTVRWGLCLLVRTVRAEVVECIVFRHWQASTTL